MKKHSTLVFIYNSFNDPLFQNLLFIYIKTLSRKTKGKFHIITFEQPKYFLDDTEKKEIKKALSSEGIYWYPMRFHTGKLLLLKKAWDFFIAFIIVIYIRLRYKTSIVFSFANVSAAFSIIFAKLLLMKMIIYSYEPHSDFLAEFGHWKRSSLKYKLLSYLEGIAGRKADYIMTGTKYMIEKLVRENSKAIVYRAPTAVDCNEFYFRENGRKELRKLLKIEDKKVFLYLGKFGDLYYTHQIPELFGEIYKRIPDSFFLVVTSNVHSDVREMFRNYLPHEAFFITGNLTYEEVKNYISASDIGISGVPFSESQKYRSPTKVAEYLCCGIPYITTKGVSEDDIYAVKYNVGLVLENFDKKAINAKIPLLLSFLNEDKERQRNRCRRVALEYRSMSRIDAYLEEIYNQII